MPGVVEVPVSTRQQGNLKRSMSKEPDVFDEPISLILPRALILIILWIAWTFAWSGVTQVALSKNYQFVTGAPLSFFDYWQQAVMHVTNIGSNDINPINSTGRTWLALYALFTVGFLYALISVLQTMFVLDYIRRIRPP